jgi:hypothetical protein
VIVPLLGATATNMAYMLSAQLAAMLLNVEPGFVSGNPLVYAPGTNSANSLGFATVNDLMSEALDKANKHQTFVQSTPCPFTF